MQLSFRAINEPRPGPEWCALFEETWPSYRAWFLKEGAAARPTYLESTKALRRHMPELMPVYENLVDLAGGGDIASRMLSLYRPTPYLAGCSQLAWSRGEPALFRNYEYSPDKCEGVLLRSRWRDRAVVGMRDCLWGVLDGVSEAGLAVALAFGGRKIVGDGFGVPLVLRYILEVCDDTKDAVRRLERLPVHMAYNVTLIDASGAHATVYLSPDRDAVVRREPIATNHQGRIEWEEYAKVTSSTERERFLRDCMANPLETDESMLAHFLRPPLFSRRYNEGWGTLYTACYRPTAGSVDLLWPGVRWRQSIDAFAPQGADIAYAA